MVDGLCSSPSALLHYDWNETTLFARSTFCLIPSHIHDASKALLLSRYCETDDDITSLSSVHHFTLVLNEWYVSQYLICDGRLFHVWADCPVAVHLSGFTHSTLVTDLMYRTSFVFLIYTGHRRDRNQAMQNLIDQADVWKVNNICQLPCWCEY